jgi:hypothetical protein
MAKDTVNRMLENSPLPTLIQKMGEAIAEAQYSMDRSGIKIFALMADTEENGIMLPGRTEPASMIELGFTPTFYHYSETTLEARVAFSMTESSEFSLGVEIGVVAKCVSVSINASYTQKYSFSAEGSSSVTTKLVSIPPPAALNEIINDLRAERAAAVAAGN